MPWLLTTPYTGGTLDVGGTYDQVKIRRLTWDDTRQMVHVQLEYGTTVATVWTPGLNPTGKITTKTYKDDEYIALITHVSNNSELTYAAVKRGIYEKLAADGDIDAGAIV